MKNVAVVLMLFCLSGCDKPVQTNSSDASTTPEKIEPMELDQAKGDIPPKVSEVVKTTSSFKEIELVDGVVMKVPLSMEGLWGYEYCEKVPKACSKVDSGESAEKFAYDLDGHVQGFSFEVPIAHAFDTDPIFAGKTRNADKIEKYKKCKPNDDEKTIAEELGSYSETSEFRCRGGYIFAIDRQNGGITYSMLWRQNEDMS